MIDEFQDIRSIEVPKCAGSKERKKKLQYPSEIRIKCPQFGSKITVEQAEEVASVFFELQMLSGEEGNEACEQVIDHKYVKDILRGFGLDMSPMDIKTALEYAGVEGSDKVSFHHFMKLLDYIMKSRSNGLELERAYRLFDQDDKGYINGEDLMRASKAAGENMCQFEIQELMDAADTTKEGIVSFDDFLNFMKTVHLGLEEISIS